MDETQRVAKRSHSDEWYEGYMAALSGKPSQAERGAPQQQRRDYESLMLLTRAFRTDNKKIVVGIPERHPRGIPLAGTPAQVRKKLMQYVGEKFDEWMAMKPDPHLDRDSFTVHETVAEDESDDPNFAEAAAANAAEQNVPTAQTKTLPFPSTSGETGQSKVNEDDVLID